MRSNRLQLNIVKTEKPFPCGLLPAAVLISCRSPHFELAPTKSLRQLSSETLTSQCLETFFGTSRSRLGLKSLENRTSRSHLGLEGSTSRSLLGTEDVVWSQVSGFVTLGLVNVHAMHQACGYIGKKIMDLTRKKQIVK